MKNIKRSFIINVIISFLVLIGTIFMFSGVTFMPEEKLLETKGIEMFKFFTVDSNILMGMISLIMAIYEYRLLNGKIKELPLFIYKLKLIGTSAVLLTFITTLCFIAPHYGFYAMYNNNNLFFHLIVPVLAFVSYVFFEKHENNYLYAFYGLIPMGIYAVFYITNIFIHYTEGENLYKYDFYGFLQGNIDNFYIVIPIIFVVTYLLTILMVFLHKKFAK